ncbi:MAG: PEP-CTERM sorting domain-containing protein [Pirellula sp.]
MRVDSALRLLMQSLLLVAVMATFPLTSHAGLKQVYYADTSDKPDEAFEYRGGWLQKQYELKDIVTPDGKVSDTVLPQTQRSVAQLALGSQNGLFVPGKDSGIPGEQYEIAGGEKGSGVHTALTNFDPISEKGNGGEAGGNFSDFVEGASREVKFEFRREDSRMVYVVSDGKEEKKWVSDANDYFKESNALALRLQSAFNSQLYLKDLVYRDEKSDEQKLEDIKTGDGRTAIMLLEGILGNFSLTGYFAINGGDAKNPWSQQIMALTLPGGAGGGGNQVVPEPTSIAIVGLLSGAFGILRRRKRA